MNIYFVSGDVFEMEADALVFSANKEPIIGGSLDASIYKHTNREQLLEARKAHGTIKSGNACMTESFGLRGYKWLIHAVSPVYQPKHPTSTTNQLKKCYLAALTLAEEKGLKRLNFTLLGGGAKGFSNRRAKSAARSAIEEYFAENPDSSIKYVTIVEYKKEDEYQALIECNNCLRRLYELLPQISGGEHLLEQTSQLGAVKNAVVEKLMQYTLTETELFKRKYEADKQEYMKTHSIYNMTFEDHIYSQLVIRPKDTTNTQFSERIFIRNDSDVSKIFNYISNPNCRNQVKSFLSKRMNVLKLGLGLNLSYEDTCRLMWSQGHDFPSNYMDYEIANSYIQTGLQDAALRDYEYEFRSARNPSEENKSVEK